MRIVLRALLMLIGVALCIPAAQASDSRAWFDQAVQYDLSGEGGARQAFTWYRRAAEAGLPEAEFNVAVMLDSGRGVEPDLAGAATWYARAAVHGNQRAAYNLGQLYEAGQGVPKNADLARAWYSACALAAAHQRLAAMRPHEAGGSVLTPPTPVAPSAGTTPSSRTGGVELVWTASQQPVPVRFFVELRKVEPTGSREIFSDFTETSSILAAVPDEQGDYAWRVLAIARVTGRYEASAWSSFRLAPH